MKFYSLLCLASLVFQPVFAQIEDDFADKNHTFDPSWYGETGKFIISNEEKLQLDAPAQNGSAYLSTPSQAIADANWQCLVEINVNPSSTNYAKFYLTSNQLALDSSLAGFFVKIGGTTDEVSLYRQDGLVETKIIDGTDGRVNTSTVSINVKVVRDISGHWELFTKPASEQTFVSEGSVEDATHTQAAYTGIFCSYTSTRSTAFAFDNFVVTGSPQPDLTSPTLTAYATISDHQLALTFSEVVTQEIAEQTANYFVGQQMPVSAMLMTEDSLVLAFAQPFTNADSLLLQVRNITDLAGNVMADTSLSLFYFEQVAAQFRDIVINEILADPNPQLDSLPDDTNAEFIELYNRSKHPFSLKNWQLNGKYLPEILLLPEHYLILCRPEYVAAYQPYGNTASISSWPSLSNSRGQLTLTDPDGLIIDAMAYQSELVSGGISIEQINPDKSCGFADNYTLSTDSNGATPGKCNATFDNTPDAEGPLLLETQAVASDTLLLYFDEPIYAENPSIMLSPAQIVKSWQVDQDAAILQVVTEKPMLSETLYIINIANIKDCQGNMQRQQTAEFYFDQTPPQVASIVWIDTATLRVHFHEKIEKTIASSVENYVLLPDSLKPKKVIFGADSASVLLTFAQKLDENPDYQLKLTEIADLSGNYASLIYPFQLANALDTVIVINEYQLDLVFHQSLAEDAAENISHYQLDAMATPRAAILHQTDDKLVHLMFNKPIAANKAHTILASNLQGTAGNLLQTPGYHFVYDTKPPKVQHITVTDGKQLRVIFEEPIDPDLSGLEASIEGVTIRSTVLITDRSLLVTLQNNLVQEQTYQLAISGVTDRYGNQLKDQQSVAFVYDTEPPTLTAWKLLSPTLLKLYFHEPLQDSSSTITNNYLLQKTGYPASAVHSQTDPAVVYLDFAQSIPDECLLSIQHIADLQGNILQDSLFTTITNHMLQLGAVHGLSAHTIKVTFTKEVNAEKFSLSQFVLNDSITASHIADLPDDPSSIIVTFEQALHTNNRLEIKADGKIIHQPINVKFEYSTKVSSIAQNALSSLSIVFSVPVILPEDAVNYFLIAAIGHPAAVVQTDAFTFQLLFDKDFQAQKLYILEISSFADAEYGYIPASTHTFGSGTSPQRHELLITEIMADPSPVVGLPAAEYLELYNPTHKIIDLRGITLSDGQTTATFPASVLMPKSYMVVCSKTDATLFSTKNLVMGLSSFPSLNIAGDVLVLKNEDGTEIFSVSYTDTWYNDAQKRGGGWSLEMIDTQRPCGEMENWTASTNPQGGTPGTVNTVQTANPDHQPPAIQKVFVVGESMIQVVFNEKIDPASIQAGYFLLSEGLQVQTMEILSEKDVMLTLHQEVPANTLISIRAKTITDCEGNPVKEEHQLTFARPEKAAKGDIVLNELLFNPRAGGVPFVELYNRSDKYIDLQYWQLANIKDAAVTETRSISTTPLILPPHQYIALTKNSKILKADYPAAIEDHLYTISMPALYVSEGTLQLLDAESNIMEDMHYDERMHHPLTKDAKGVSLEKISWDTTVNHTERWQSAASSAGFATPGYRNSQMMQQIKPLLLLSVEPKIFSPYQDVQSYTTIYYQTQEAGSVATLNIFNTQGKKVCTLLDQQTLGQEGWVTWNGTDQNMKPLPIGHYIILMQVYDLKGNVSSFKTKVVVASPF